MEHRCKTCKIEVRSIVEIENLLCVDCYFKLDKQPKLTEVATR